MLKHIQLKNFAIIDHLDLDLHKNMTVITGETGAGKSIMIDAIELALGQRVKHSVIKGDSDRCEICLNIDIQQISAAKDWLTEHALDQGGECLVRRVIYQDGRSKSFINDTPCTLQHAKALGESLIDIHGQHEQQKLFNKSMQRDMLDAYAAQQVTAKKVAQLFQQWQITQTQLNALLNNNLESKQRAEFLKYQLQELDEINVSKEELEQLEQDHKKLANAQQLIEACNAAMLSSAEEEGAALTALNRACQQLQAYTEYDKGIKDASELFNSAIIQTQEAADTLRHFLDKMQADPARLQEIETRLGKIYDIARKHHVKSRELPDFHQTLLEELSTLENSDEHIETLKQKISELEADYHTAAKKLSSARKKSAKSLSESIMVQLKRLGMPQAIFHVALTATEKLTAHGLEHVEFLINTNPSQSPQALAKIASGGELSRISLAIQVILAEKYTTPTIVFDEVDVGIGGATAEIVGQLLKKLSQHTQLLVITHLGQVAGQGQQHLKISKQQKKDATNVQVAPLNQEQRVQEIARMIGGKTITEQTLAHAAEMLS
jgi:DNA repair protein RecN (Recombination protein N)